jgi:protein ImuB
MQAGVRAQMPLPLAQALCPDAYVEPFDPLRDFEALSALARWCLRFSPLVGLDQELLSARGSTTLLEQVDGRHYGITIDLTGTERLHGGLRECANLIFSIFKGRARVALTPTIGASWALSRYMASEHPLVILSCAEIPATLEDLPLHALRIDDTCVRLLNDVGIRRIGEVLTLPRHTLSQRFGKKLQYRLVQALGGIEERLLAIEVAREFTTSRTFEPPLTSRRSIVLAIQHLFQSLVTELKTHKKAAKYFQLSIVDTMNRETRKELSLAAANSDHSHLSSVIEPIIDALEFFGEVRDVGISAHQIESTNSEQDTFSASEQRHPTEKERQELMNNFCVRIGKDRVTFAKLSQSYIPERSFSYHSALSSEKEGQVAEQVVPYNLNERPSILFPSPEPISTIAMLPDKPPSYINWRGKRFSITTGIGPERIAPEWWRLNLQNDSFAERDYFKIQDEIGRWLWVYRDSLSLKWFLHGMWM